MEVLKLCNKLLIFRILLVLRSLFPVRNGCHDIRHQIKFLIVFLSSITSLRVSFDTILINLDILIILVLLQSWVPRLFGFIQSLPENSCVKLRVSSVESIFIFKMLELEFWGLLPWTTLVIMQRIQLTYFSLMHSLKRGFVKFQKIVIPDSQSHEHVRHILREVSCFLLLIDLMQRSLLWVLL